MSRLIFISLSICLFVCLGYVHSLPPQIIPKAKMEEFRELMKCTHEKCEDENKALKALFKDELDKCLKTCNIADMKMAPLEEAERKKFRDCFRANNCKLPYEHIRANRDTPQFKAAKECAESKCGDQYSKIREMVV